MITYTFALIGIVGLLDVFIFKGQIGVYLSSKFNSLIGRE